METRMDGYCKYRGRLSNGHNTCGQFTPAEGYEGRRECLNCALFADGCGPRTRKGEKGTRQQILLTIQVGGIIPRNCLGYLADLAGETLDREFKVERIASHLEPALAREFRQAFGCS